MNKNKSEILADKIKQLKNLHKSQVEKLQEIVNYQQKIDESSDINEKNKYKHYLQILKKEYLLLMSKYNYESKI